MSLTRQLINCSTVHLLKPLKMHLSLFQQKGNHIRAHVAWNQGSNPSFALAPTWAKLGEDELHLFRSLSRYRISAEQKWSWKEIFLFLKCTDEFGAVSYPCQRHNLLEPHPTLARSSMHHDFYLRRRPRTTPPLHPLPSCSKSFLYRALRPRISDESHHRVLQPQS